MSVDVHPSCCNVTSQHDILISKRKCKQNSEGLLWCCYTTLASIAGVLREFFNKFLATCMINAYPITYFSPPTLNCIFLLLISIIYTENRETQITNFELQCVLQQPSATTSSVDTIWMAVFNFWHLSATLYPRFMLFYDDYSVPHTKYSFQTYKFTYNLFWIFCSQLIKAIFESKKMFTFYQLSE